VRSALCAEHDASPLHREISMAQPKNQQTESDLPAGLAQPAIRALHGAGYTRLEQLTAVTEADLRKLHGMGPKGINTLRRALKARGLALAKASPQKKKS